MTQKTTTRKPTEIQAATINRVSDKSGKFLGYLVKSNSSENYYQVTYNTSANRYECNCVATCKCCHIKAVEQVQAVRVESQKQGNTSPATAAKPVATYIQDGQVHTVECVEGTLVDNVSATDEHHRVSRVDGIVTKWYPEYRDGAEWYRFPQPDGNQEAHCLVEGRAEQWLADRLAAVAEQEAEAKMDAFLKSMDEQYASDPRQGLSQGEVESARSNMVHLYDEY